MNSDQNAGLWNSDETKTGNASRQWNHTRRDCSGSTRENAADLALAIDALEELYCGQADSIAIVSGDSDLIPLALKLREHGKPVRIFGYSFTSPALGKSATEFHSIGWFQQELDGNLNLFNHLRSRMADLINDIGGD